MKIKDILRRKKPVLSFEFFPPKTTMSTLSIGETIGELKYLQPDYVSVTYGAGGSSQDMSFTLNDHINNRTGLTTMAHYTCVGASRDKVKSDLLRLKELNIENLMLLRGDPPSGQGDFEPAVDGFAYAAELVAFSRKLGNFCIGVAGYPEKHIQAPDMKTDLKYLKEKVDAGADFIVTQMFFKNEYYFRFLEQVRDIGIKCPVIPGIMPITNYKNIAKFAKMTNTSIPPEIIKQFEGIENNPAKMLEVGTNIAYEQCSELLDAVECPGIHFYTLNKSSATLDIFKKLNFIRR
ncbi:MAG TPA: methylenetetrahydrofolate reductase [NAD(P)H] [Spirochaetota bacterium]|nr:methylenetetrahydrofolate reductase [NAD(P)H] [Spirochaetota bacterium]